MRAQSLTLIWLAGMLLAGCASAPVVVNYRASGNEQALPAEAGHVVVNRFIDDRGEAPRWLGAIRGGFGNPLKVLETDEPVAVMVQTAIAEGVRARGGAKPGAPKLFELRGSIKRLDCSQYVRREAHGVIDIAVIDIATGRQRFQRTYRGDLVDGSLLSMGTGIFASVDDLKRVAEQVLQQIVDKALDDPALRDAMRS